jgi:predicted regulator of Ras-like GTPase activity (Roadblock/LC7/MglB family)
LGREISNLLRGESLGNLDQQALIDRMRILQHGVPEVEAAAVISLDGLLMASALPEGMSEDRISAMSAAMLSLGEQINKEMGLGTLEQLYTRGSNGYVVLLAVGKDAVLTTLVQPEAKLGVLFLELRKTAEDLARLLDGNQ